MEKGREAVLYCRVSTGKQVMDGVSLDAQEDRAKAWATAHGYTVAGIFKDAGLSGSRADNRDGLQSALEMACQRGAALVCFSLSRLARSTKDALTIAERLDKAGADLVSLSESIDTTSAAGKMVFRMLAVLAEFERDLISERTRAAMAHMKANGKKTGGRFCPFGYDVDGDGNLIENPDEQRAIVLIQELRGKGYSLRQIAAELERRGILTKGGGKWTAKAVRAALKRAA